MPNPFWTFPYQCNWRATWKSLLKALYGQIIGHLYSSSTIHFQQIVFGHAPSGMNISVCSINSTRILVSISFMFLMAIFTLLSKLLSTLSFPKLTRVGSENSLAFPIKWITSGWSLRTATTIFPFTDLIKTIGNTTIVRLAEFKPLQQENHLFIQTLLEH